MDNILPATLSVLMFLGTYWLPGASFYSVFEWKGIGRRWRWLIPFALSLIIAPLSLGALTALSLSAPLALPLAIVCGFWFCLGMILRRAGKRPILEFRRRVTDPITRTETAWMILAILAVGFIAFLPRLDLLLRGTQTSSAGISDIYYHLSELTSLARSGLPPRHFLFPDIPLDYYYWSWLLPAAAAGLPILGSSLMRVMNAHVLATLLVYLSLLWVLLRANIGSGKARWLAFGSLTLFGGLDFFSDPNTLPHEWWQAAVPWLISPVQIPSFLVTYMWVPQHISGLIACLVVVLLWRNMRGNLYLRMLLTVGCAAFLFGASAFVFFAFGLAGLVWAWLYRRIWLRPRAIPVLLLAVGAFLLCAGPQLLLTVGQEGVLQWSGFRLNLFEALGTPSRYAAAWFDQVATWLMFPVVASVVMTIEMGLPFVLYLLFAFRNARSISRWRRFLVIFPALYLPFAFFLLPPNFGMRGILPALVAINLAAALWMCDARGARWSVWQKWVLAYGLVVVLLLQTISPFIEWLPLARRSVANILRPATSQIALPITFPDGDNALIPAFLGLPKELAYIRWANVNLPVDALVAEEGPLPHDNRLHLLERMRIANPADVSVQANGQRDLTLAGGADLDGWWNSLPGLTIAEKAKASAYAQAHHPPIYLIVRSGLVPDGGELVYQDELVRIYRIH
jgi:hypothetical protein